MEKKIIDIPKSLLILTAWLLLRYPLAATASLSIMSTATTGIPTATFSSSASTSIMSTTTTGIPIPTSPSECFNYRFLDESNRARTYYNITTVLCDTLLSGWYRFTGEAGNQMADTCVGHKHCGTDAPGWLNGDHPTVADGAVQRKVCFRGRTNCCPRSTDIIVRNCGGFYVYQLQRPPFCNSRYCGSGISAPSVSTAPTGIPTPTSSSASMPTATTRIPTPTLSSVCFNYIFLNESNRARTYYNTSTLLCDKSLWGWYRFSGEAGNQMANTCAGYQHCGTVASGWLNGDHPSVADGVVLRKVCFRGRTNCCLNSTGIIVRNCGGFYVYRLKSTPFCASRYCGNGISAPSASTSPKPVTPKPVCPNLKTLSKTSGPITSPFYPESYPANLTCSWQITASRGKRVKLVIDYMDIQACAACTCDYLEILNGSFADGFQRHGRECGGSFGNITYYSNLESLKVLFVSDGTVQLSGFRATYTQLNYNISTECSNYRFLNESNRSIKYLNWSISSLCDSNLSPGWYRFSGEAGNQMAESCVSSFLQYCSTDAHGWLSGSHPVVSEGVVQRKVCFPGIFSCCFSSTNISVRNCGAFFVYKLQPTAHCFLRYCGNGLPQAPECLNYNFLNETSRARTYNKSFPRPCADTSLSGWYRFSGEAGNKMADTCVNMNWCGANYTGWLSGGHPEVADGAVMRKVCFTRSRRSCCGFSVYINVRNCGQFYVYKLKPLLSCMLRYCGSGVSLPTSMTPATEPSTPTSATTIETTTPKLSTPTNATTVEPTTSKSHPFSDNLIPRKNTHRQCICDCK